MRLLFFLILYFFLSQCSNTSSVYWCGDHECVNKKEREVYFQKTMIVEVKKINKDEKKDNSNLEIINWGETPNFDMVINVTSLGLNKFDEIKINYEEVGSNKLFYDIIYNPPKTNFLLKAKQFGNQIENGKMMFIYQAQLAFKIWHNILPNINTNLLD